MKIYENSTRNVREITDSVHKKNPFVIALMVIGVKKCLMSVYKTTHAQSSTCVVLYHICFLHEHSDCWDMSKAKSILLFCLNFGERPTQGSVKS